MCNKYSDTVVYITEIIDGLERALDKDAIGQLYSEYITQINEYNDYINKLLTSRKNSARYYKIPDSLSVFKYTHLRAAIILRLMDSVKSWCFEDLDTEDLIYILGNTTPKQLHELERLMQRRLMRPEYRTRFTNIRDDIVTIAHMNGSSSQKDEEWLGNRGQ